MMDKKLRKRLESSPIEASAPCRIDMGGTVDIPTFYYPLRHLSPCTFNIALELRTRVRLLPFTRGRIKISSRGFKDAQFPADAAPFKHPMGLMFATAAFFRAEGIHIDIESQSPPRSALGGSSAAALALIAAFLKMKRPAEIDRRLNRRRIALLAYQLEQSTSGVACGFQDQLAAAYGGVNLWHWQTDPDRSVFRRTIVVGTKLHKKLAGHLLLAYCGQPHESKDINGRWLKQFLAGENRDLWSQIIASTHQFADALAGQKYDQAVVHMNRETGLRRKLTPDVLDKVGEHLVDLALQNNCGARFTGAGGGGCLWAIGETAHIDKLRPLWQEALSARKEADLLEVGIDSKGVNVY